MTYPSFSLSNVLPLLFCLLLALISCRVYLQPGLPSTHDSENHLARFANYKIALKEGQLPPRFAPNLYHQYGYPVFNYNYPLPNILSVPFSLIKTPYQVTFKVIMVSAVTGLLLGVWQWLSLMGFKLKAKVFAVLSIATAPYLLSTVLFRGSIGEMLAAAGIAWWLVWVDSVRQRGMKISSATSWKDILFSAQTVFGGMLLGAFFLSHNVTVLFGTPLMLLFALWWLWPVKKSLWKVFGAFVIGLGLSLWFWIPAMFEQSAIVVSGSSLSSQFLQHFPTLHELISAPLKFGFSFVGSVDSLSFALGAAQWIALFCVTGWVISALFGQKTARQQFDSVGRVFFGLSVVLILFQLSFTAPIWQAIPFARFIQFPWRLGVFLLFTNATLIAWVCQKSFGWQQKLIALALLLQLIIAWNIVPSGFFNKPSIEYDVFPQSTTTGNENLPKSFTFEQFADWQPTAVILNGKGSVSVQKWTGSKRNYTVVAETPVVIVEPTMYFPGWESTATSGNSYRLVEYLDNKEVGGRIAYALEPGTYEIQSEFTQHTLPRIAGNISSVITFGFVLGASAWLVTRKVQSLRNEYADASNKK